MQLIKIPEHPLILPRPKLVKCPRDSCGAVWYWRSWWQGNVKTACSICKSTVIPIEVPSDFVFGKSVKLIRCTQCSGLQWYVGGKERTGCTANGCNKKNVPVRAISPDELGAIISTYSGEFTPEEQEYYKERLEEYEHT